jgi:hypothetical protein
MRTERFAYVTTASSMPSGDPGILVQEYENDDGTLIGVGDLANETFPPGWGEDEDGEFDRRAIDEALQELGYRRVGNWSNAGDQLTATVEKLS